MGEGNVDEFMGNAKARLRALEERGAKWDTSIDKLKSFQAKASVLAFIGMLAASFIMNFIIKIMGWS
ncbi:MAG: hypothetical protein OQK32_04010 [Gammaproteobacteria bacterium]|nr:hypothetical protein [Gammaproteobacteria bacterium]MCW8923684.1 hypothetical protein [Gammaproteobacteria bacterium]